MEDHLVGFRVDLRDVTTNASKNFNMNLNQRYSIDLTSTTQRGIINILHLKTGRHICVIPKAPAEAKSLGIVQTAH